MICPKLDLSSVASYIIDYKETGKRILPTMDPLAKFLASCNPSLSFAASCATFEGRTEGFSILIVVLYIRKTS